MYCERDGTVRGYPPRRAPRRSLPPGLGNIWDTIGKVVSPIVTAVKQALPGAAQTAVQTVTGAAQRAGAQQIAASPEGQAELRRQAMAGILPYALAGGALLIALSLRPPRR